MDNQLNQLLEMTVSGNIHINTESMIYYILFTVGFVLILIILTMIETIIEHFESNWKNKYTEILDTKNPSLSELRQVRHSIFYYTQSNPIKRAIALKLKSYQSQMTVMDSMMTPQQLYSTKNILWARGLSLQDIETVLTLEDDIDVETEIFPFLDTAN